MTQIIPPPDAVVLTNRGGFIQSMNAAAGMMLGIAPTSKARPVQIGGLFVQGRISLRLKHWDSGSDDLQRILLEAEGVHFDSTGRIDLKRFRWQPTR